MTHKTTSHPYPAHLIKGTQTINVLPICELVAVTLQNPELLFWAIIFALCLLKGPQLSGQVPHSSICLIKLLPGFIGSC